MDRIVRVGFAGHRPWHGAHRRAGDKNNGSTLQGGGSQQKARSIKLPFNWRQRPDNKTTSILPATEVIGEWQVTVELSPEMQKIDINLASETDLSTAFQLVGIEPDLADSLAAETLDWRDTDDLARVNGAEEKRDYARVPDKPPPANRAFASVARVNGTTLDDR